MSQQSPANAKTAYGGGLGGQGGLLPSSGLHSQLDTALDIVQRCAHKSDMVLERIIGPRPQTAAIAEDQPSYNMPEKISQIINHLTHIDERLGDILNRF